MTGVQTCALPIYAGVNGWPLTHAQDAPHGLMIKAGAEGGFAITLVVVGEKLLDTGLKWLRIVMLLECASARGGWWGALGHGVSLQVGQWIADSLYIGQSESEIRSSAF